MNKTENPGAIEQQDTAATIECAHLYPGAVNEMFSHNFLAVSVGSSVKAQSQADPSQVSGATPTSNIPLRLPRDSGVTMWSHFGL